MKKIHVSFYVKVPSECSDNDITEWVSYSVAEQASISQSNPIADFPMECVAGTLYVEF